MKKRKEYQFRKYLFLLVIFQLFSLFQDINASPHLKNSRFAESCQCTGTYNYDFSSLTKTGSDVYSIVSDGTTYIWNICAVVPSCLSQLGDDTTVCQNGDTSCGTLPSFSLNCN